MVSTMCKQKGLISTYWLAVVLMLALLGPLAQNGRCDFTLYGNEQLTVDSYHYSGALYDTSRVFIVSGGEVNYRLDAYNSSTVNISDGSVYLQYMHGTSTADISGGSVYALYPYESSTVNISGGNVSQHCAPDHSSTVNISGGSMSYLVVYGSSVTNISGGVMTKLAALNSSTVIFHGQNFSACGLTFDGNRVLGTGFLSGEWTDGTPWTVNITSNELTATILVVVSAHTLLVQTEPNDITTVTPSVGQHTCSGWVDVNASRFVDCPKVYCFDHWVGDIEDANSANTRVFMNSDKTITAVFRDNRQCGDECHPYPSGDISKDCRVDFLDIAMVAASWLECTRPECD